MATVNIVFGIFYTFVILLWLSVPFVIFRIKNLLQALLDEQKKTNALLTRGAALPAHDAPEPTAIPLATRRYP